MSHKKAGGSTALGRDSVAKRLGVKKFAGEVIKAGNIIVRQRGSKFVAGQNVAKGVDDTLFATESGILRFRNKRVKRFTGKVETRIYVDVIAKDASQKEKPTSQKKVAKKKK